MAEAFGEARSSCRGGAARPRYLTLPLLLTFALGAAGCGEDAPESGSPGPGGSAPQEQASGAGGERCEEVMVPGHVGTEVTVAGTDCDTAAEVIEGAVGQGREPYEAAGFACEPTGAGEGTSATDYSCTGAQGATITFTYDAA